MYDVPLIYYMLHSQRNMVADVDVALDMKFDSFAWQAEKRTPQQLLTSQNRSLTPYQGSKRQIYSV